MQTRRTRQRRNTHAVTEVTEIKGRDHALTIDSGWNEVTDTAPRFAQTHAPAA